MITLRIQSSPQWVKKVLENFDTFLLDHAAAEKKASGMAISMLSHYPDRPQLVRAMADLAVEEMTHFRDVVRLIQKRGIQLQADDKDPYINRIRQALRKPSEQYFLDRLLTAAIIEARGCERFGLIGEAHPDPALAKFYQALSKSEARHHLLFFDLAQLYFDHNAIVTRTDELLDIEAEILRRLPLRAALH